jgi:hypothetical protein
LDRDIGAVQKEFWRCSWGVIGHVDPAQSAALTGNVLGKLDCVVVGALEVVLDGKLVNE